MKYKLKFDYLNTYTYVSGYFYFKYNDKHRHFTFSFDNNFLKFDINKCITYIRLHNLFRNNPRSIYKIVPIED